jgi:hypothetical protein
VVLEVGVVTNAASRASPSTEIIVGKAVAQAATSNAEPHRSRRRAVIERFSIRVIMLRNH